jgi:PKD repeat protein
MVGGLAVVLTACGGGGGGGGGDGGGSVNTPPQARFSATPTTGAAPLQVAFDGSGSTDAGGSIASYAWTFGDGGTGAGATIQHTYQATGTYTATLVVTDNQGAASTPFTRTIEVRAPGGLAVTVRDDLNAPVSGATVGVTIGTVTRQGTTDALGQVTLSDLPLGSASIEVTKTGYVSGTATATVVAGATSTVNARIVRRVGSLSVTVVENTLGDPIAGADVSAASDGRTIAAVTGLDGVALLSGIPTGTASITVAADGFLEAAPQSKVIAEGDNGSITVRLDRVRSAAAGFSGGEGVVVPGSNGTEARLTLRFVVIDADSQPVTTLTAGDFRLQPCVEPANTNDCIRGLVAGLDGSYSPVTPGPEGFRTIPSEPGAPYPYSAALLFDQSKSIGRTDPTDARIFGGKTLLGSVRPGGTDWVSLAAFAADFPDTDNGPSLLPPPPPLHIYPPGFTQDGASFYPDIDTFPTLESGDTPFYAALDLMIDELEARTERKAVVVFSDAVDNDSVYCPSAQACRARTVAVANAADVSVFTIGLSTSPGVNVEALADLANRTGGTFLLAPDASALIPIYGSLGALLSGSLLQYETVWTVRSPTANAFRSGYFVSGKMDIDIGAEVITVPFVVAIP